MFKAKVPYPETSAAGAYAHPAVPVGFERPPLWPAGFVPPPRFDAAAELWAKTDRIPLHVAKEYCALLACAATYANMDFSFDDGWAGMKGTPTVDNLAWNPLRWNDDALALAVALDIFNTQVAAFQKFFANARAAGFSAQFATRIAIVKVAVEMGPIDKVDASTDSAETSNDCA